MDAFPSYNTPYEKIGNEVVSLEDEIPFEIPDSWEWVRLGIVSTYAETKEKINAQNADPSIWGLDLEDIEKGGRLLCKKRVSERKAIGDKTLFFRGDILYSKLRPYLLKILVADDDGICTPEIVPFKMYGGINPEYIVFYLQSPYVDNYINSITYGVKMPRVGTETMVSLLVPLPPLNEQNRIVNKIKEVIPTVAEYEKATDQIDNLNNSFPEQLKKSILQWAVQGKLVPQDENDEPAEVLLERIRAEKEALIKAGTIKRDKHESVIFRRDNSHYEKRGSEVVCIDDELPFEIPASWRWVRAQTISTKEIKRGKSPQYTENSTVYVFAQKCNVKAGGINMRLAKFLDVSAFCRYPMEEQMIDGDIIVNSTGEGTLGRIGIFRDSDRLNDYPIVPDSHVAIIRTSREFAENYIYYVFRYYQAYLESLGEGSTKQTELKPAVLAELFVPIPPLEEQHRIVESLDKILSVSEQL